MDDFDLRRDRATARPECANRSNPIASSKQNHGLAALWERPRHDLIPEFLEDCVIGARYYAAIPVAETGRQEAKDVTEAVSDLPNASPVSYFAVAAEYLRLILEAYADEVLATDAPNAHRRVWHFKGHPKVITNHLNKYFRAEAVLVNQNRREQFNSGESVEGWHSASISMRGLRKPVGDREDKF